MTRNEFKRLAALSKSIKQGYTHRRSIAGRRHVKGHAKGYGQILRYSSVRSETYDSLETVAPLTRTKQHAL